MRIRRLATSLVAMFALLHAPRLSAQRVSLEQVDSLMRAGQTEQARTQLDRWNKSAGTSDRTSPNDARALFLGARLSAKAEDAEDLYLTVALSHATSPYAAESLLRLGQARMASGDAKQGSVYLERLLADYPGTSFRPLAALWLARAQSAGGRAPAACATLGNALQLTQVDSETVALLRTEQSMTCNQPARITAEPARPAPQPERTPPAATTVPNPASASSARVTIQVAAFRERAGARSVARQLERAGFTDVRLATVPDNALIRVRIGRFESASAAAATVARLKNAGFSVVVVSDALREQLVRD